MSSFQTLFEPTPLQPSLTVLFTAQSQTRIDKLTVADAGGAPDTLNVYLVPVGRRPQAYNQIIVNRPIQSYETWDVYPAMGHVLNTGDMLVASCVSPNAITIFASGTVT